MFTLVWASNWEEMANQILAPALSLQPLPYISFSHLPGRMGQSYKLRAVKKFVNSRHLAWLDDEVGEDMDAWAQKRWLPTLIRPIDPRVGLNDGDVEALLLFIQ